MNCNDFKSVELRKILVDNNIAGRGKMTTKAEMCKVIQKLGLLSSKAKNPAPSKIAVSKSTLKAKSHKNTKTPKSRKSAKKPAKIKEEKKELKLADNLVAHGFIPKHKSDEADEALKYLQRIVKHFSLTTQCQGYTENQKWFQYLLKQEQFHPSLEATTFLTFAVQDQSGSLKVITKESELNVIRQQIATHKNIVVPMAVIYRHISGSHANMILINASNKRYEWFEPHGLLSKLVETYGDDYDKKVEFRVQSNLQTFLKTKLASLFNIPNDYQFANPFDECPYKLGPQGKQANDIREECRDGGFCLTYATVYAHLRFLSPDATPAQTVQTLMNMENDEILDFIRRYVQWQSEVGLRNTGYVL